jgi:hypothetical protein
MSLSGGRGTFNRMAWCSRVPALGLALGVAVLAQACAQPREQGTSPAASAADGQCQQRIIVTFAAPAENDTVAALAAAAGVKLNVVSRLLATTYVLDLSAPDCNAALLKLRGAAGVRAVEPDARRLPHQG